jgi:hypothetical protein
MSLSTILGIIEAIWTSLSPFLKPVEQAEIAALEAQYASNPAILFILQGLAKIVNAQ